MNLRTDEELSKAEEGYQATSLVRRLNLIIHGKMKKRRSFDISMLFIIEHNLGFMLNTFDQMAHVLANKMF